MIKLDGTSTYWATGITVEYRYAGSGEYGWTAKVEYFDDGFCDDIPGTATISTQGILKTRYAVRDCEDGTSSLSSVIDAIKADVERLGITWGTASPLHVYYEGDGEDPDHPGPDGWREMVDAENVRLGWAPLYGMTAAP